MERRGWWRSALPKAVLGLLVLLAVQWRAGPQALAQPGLQFRIAAPAGAEDNADAVADNVFPPADRAILQRLSRARESLKEGHYGGALQYLGEILKAPEDFFFQPDKNVPIHRSLKAEARRLIGQMPREGRELYELKCGAEARDMLQKAVASGSAAQLAEVSGRYFHTQAGYEATFLLGLYHLDHGSPLAAALTIQRLCEVPLAARRFEPALSLTLAACWVEAGLPDDARRALLALKAQQPSLRLRVGGRELDWFHTDAEALDWLAREMGPRPAALAAEPDRWAMSRGDPARNAANHASPPLLNLRWEVPIADDGSVLESLRRLRQSYLEQNLPLLPAAQPLAVDNVILMRTAKNLLAVDLASGKRRWEVPVDDPLEGLAGRGNAEVAVRYGNASWASMLGQRIWDDATYGTLSSDGRLVFSVEDLRLAPGNTANEMMVFRVNGRRGVVSQGPWNRLAARDIHTGKLAWELGGPAGPSALRQADTFFLGPPLPLRGELYVLTEVHDEIRLLVLDPVNQGNLLWSQQLAAIERNIVHDPLRRLCGVTPSYADGILVCPTGAGAVVAVDLATRSLLWGYCYTQERSADSNLQRQRQLMVMRFGNYGGLSPMARWLDATAVIVEGRVLLTPPEADALYCLNLIDGKPLWPALPRKDDLYLACVRQGTITLVGRREVRAVRLADGKPAWDGRTVALPETATVSGRGFSSGDQYYVPLSSAEVAAVDLQAGKTVRLSKSRAGDIPGNLICYQGKVISQGYESVAAFFQVDAARSWSQKCLAANPNDASALTLNGELLLDENKSVEAIACFRRACGLTADSHARDLLRGALLDGLKSDFAGYRNQASEIEGLLDDPAQRITYLRLMATGFEQAGQWREALAQYLKLADLDCKLVAPQRIEPALSVRRDRWVQARLAELRHGAKEEAAAEIDRAMQARLKTALDGGEVEPLRRFLAYFGSHASAATARRELVRRLAVASQLLEAELYLWPDLQSPDHATAGSAWATLAQWLAGAGSRRSESAAICYQRLADEFGDVVCRDGRTGKQLFAALAEDSPIRRALADHPRWPTGEVVAEQRPPGVAGRVQGFGRFILQYQGTPKPFYDHTMIRFDQNRNTIVAYDALGRQRWELPLVSANTGIAFGYNANMTQARAQGHLLLLSMGTRIFGIDPDGLPTGPKILWSQDLTDTGADAGQSIIIRGGAVFIGGIAFQPFAPQFQFRMDPLGPVTSRYACFQRFRNVVAIDPLSGEPLWIRHDVPATSELFGDDEYVFVLPPEAGKSEALVLRATDGALLGKRNIPRPRNSITTMSFNGVERVIYSPFEMSGMALLGRYVLLWSHEESGGRTLELYDPWQQRPLWPQRKFDAAAKASLIGNEAIAIVEPGGRLFLIALPTGKTIADLKIEPKGSFTDIFALRCGDEYYVITNDAQARTAAEQQPLSLLFLLLRSCGLLQPRTAWDQQPLQAMPGVSCQPIRHGQIYAIDAKGELRWPSPVNIENQLLLLNQPCDLPILCFAGQKFEQRFGGQQMIPRTWILCIDKQTGRVVYNQKPNNPTMSALDLAADPQKKTVELRMQTTNIVLTFTDKPVATTAPRNATAEPGTRFSSELLNGLWRALQTSLNATNE